MKLNVDCIRDILLFIEKNIGYIDKDDDAPMIHDEMAQIVLISQTQFYKYNNEETSRAVEVLIEEGYIKCKGKIQYTADGDLEYARVAGLSIKGYAILENLRNDTIWNAIKNRTKKVGKVSLGCLLSVSEQLAVALLTNPGAVDTFNDITSKLI